MRLNGGHRGSPSKSERDVSKGTKSERPGRKGKGPRVARKAKPKAKKKGPSRRGDTRKARKRAKGLIDPNVGVATTDPLRLQILAVAIQQPVSASEFAREVGIALNVASYHFGVLRDHGFLDLVEEVKVRGSTKYMYRATKSAFISDANWGEVADALRPGVAGTILQDFNGRVGQAIEAGSLFARDDACLYWAPRNLDETAWLEQVKMIQWCIEESERLEVETLDRRAKGESSGSFCATFAIAGFPSPAPEEVRNAKKKSRRSKRKAPKGKVKGPVKGKRA